MRLEKYDMVIAKEDFGNVIKGDKGTILILYNDTDYEVEFFGSDSQSKGTYTVSILQIEKQDASSAKRT